MGRPINCEDLVPTRALILYGALLDVDGWRVAGGIVRCHRLISTKSVQATALERDLGPQRPLAAWECTIRSCTFNDLVARRKAPGGRVHT